MNPIAWMGHGFQVNTIYNRYAYYIYIKHRYGSLYFDYYIQVWVVLQYYNYLNLDIIYILNNLKYLENIQNALKFKIVRRFFFTI